MGLYPTDRLENVEIRERLLKLGYKKGLVDDIIDQFWFRDWHNSLISYKPYFKLLQEYLSKNKINKFYRPDFYKFVFESKFPEKKKYDTLQKIALYFENHHTDRITVKEYNGLVKKLGNSPYFLLKFGGALDLTYFEIKEKTKERVIAWKHHTFTEYLASNYILKTKDPIKTIDEMSIYREGKFVGIKGSWYGTIRFLLESDKSEKFIEWLIQIGEKDSDNIDDDYSQLILSVDPQKLEPNTQSRLFNLIYNHYKDKTLWLPVFTRQYIGKFAQEKHLDLLKKDILKQKTEVKTFVNQGNVTAVITSLLENKNSILTKKDKEFWKSKFIKFANDPNKNGVLQRHALDALEFYNDSALIEKVKSAFDHPESLVRQAFIEFCFKTYPNGKKTIDYLTMALNSGMTIYGRIGLYEITNTNSLVYLIDKFRDDQDLLKVFLDRESIFDSKKERGDYLLIKNIQNALETKEGDKLLTALQNLILTSFKDKDAFHLEDSNFIREISQLIRDKNSNFVLDLIKQTQKTKEEEKKRLTFYIVQRILPYLITKDNLVKFCKILKENPIDFSNDAHTYAIYSCRRLLEKYGDNLYKFALEKKLVKKIPKPKEDDTPSFLRSDKNSEYEEFIKRLDDAPKRFRTDVFKYVCQTFTNIKDLMNEDGTKRLLEAVEFTLKQDPQTFTLKLNSKYNSSSFNWSNTASYYGDAIRVAKLLKKSLLKKYKQNIINFIPFSFSSDEVSISEVVKKATDKEMYFVYKSYQNTEGDLRYFQPDAFIQVASNLQKQGSDLKKAGKIILSLSEDKHIREHDRINALKKYKYFFNKDSSEIKKILFKKFEKISSKDLTNKRLALVANSLLVEIFQDKKSIDWRFDQIKKRTFKFNEKSRHGAHSVGENENELDTISFSKPLIKIANEEMEGKFLDLMSYSLKLLKKGDDDYWSYINYIWKIVISYYEKLAKYHSIQPYLRLRSWADKNVKDGKGNWFFGRLSELRKLYLNTFIKNNHGI